MPKKIQREKIQEQVLEYLEPNKKATATEIARKLGFHFYVIVSILNELMEKNRLERIDTKTLTIYSLKQNATTNPV